MTKERKKRKKRRHTNKKETEQHSDSAAVSTKQHYSSSEAPTLYSVLVCGIRAIACDCDSRVVIIGSVGHFCVLSALQKRWILVCFFLLLFMQHGSLKHFGLIFATDFFVFFSCVRFHYWTNIAIMTLLN